MKGWWLNLALNPYPVFRSIEALVKDAIPNTPVYISEIPEDKSLTYDADTGLMNPFVVLFFGGPIRAASDHSLCSSRRDTTILYVTVSCFAARSWDAIELKGLLIDSLAGARGNDFSELITGGSLSFSRSSNTVRPTQYIEEQSFTCRSNLSN